MIFLFNYLLTFYSLVLLIVKAMIFSGLFHLVDSIEELKLRWSMGRDLSDCKVCRKIGSISLRLVLRKLVLCKRSTVHSL